MTPLSPRSLATHLPLVIVMLLALALAGCGSAPKKAGSGGVAAGKGGGYYKDDGPDANPPANLDLVPDALPQVEPLASGSMRPYVIFGKRYVPDTSGQPYRARGIASWYGKKFHGARTSNGEIYDMYAMTAAHPTMPIPSYARVTRISTGKSVLVRVNDRGPFHSDRLIDLSYTAGHKLGIIGSGSGEVVVELLMPTEIARIRAERAGEPVLALAPAPVPRATEPGIATIDYSPEIEPVASTSPVSPIGTVAPVEVLAPLPAASLPPPMVAVPASAGPVPVSVPQGTGLFLQLGAFSGQRNAQDLVARVQSRVADWRESFQIVSAGNMHRVQVGPYPDRQSAEAAARQLQARADVVPVIVTR